MATPREPYLSLVVAARNDHHGGNLLGRMQAFLDGWLTQARRYEIPSELIVVEWNPPTDRPPLTEALRWPTYFGPCEVRFIEVPREVHNGYRHAAALPLYQMIAKNVGIRRSRGHFVLATNVDILFSNELAAFLSEQRLEKGSMYRIDRHDTMSGVPGDAPLDEQLAYCRTHLIRINRRDGTFDVAPDGSAILSAVDVASAGSGILLGQGWFPPERVVPLAVFRWASENAEVLLGTPPEPVTGLTVDIEPGPAAGGRSLELEVVTGQEQPLARVTVDHRTQLRFQLPNPLPDRLWFRAHGEFSPVNLNPRTLCFRAFRFEWQTGRRYVHAASGSPEAAVMSSRRSGQIVTLWRSLQHVIQKLADGGPLVSLTVPVSPRFRRLLKIYVERGGFTGMLRRPRRARTIEPPSTPHSSGHLAPEERHSRPDFLHTNACGDFTLMAREHWFDLRGYPEFDLYSMNLDSVLCFAAHYGGAREELLTEPMRVYHIEHGAGWTPEGQGRLFERLAAKGVSSLDNEEVLAWATQMRRLNSPMIFNHGDWGLAGFQLREITRRQSA